MERESLEMDVVFVGAGPANLSGALHLARWWPNTTTQSSMGPGKGTRLGKFK